MRAIATNCSPLPASPGNGLVGRAAANFPQVATYLYAEAEAESVWNWEPQVIPGLLQTRDYARAVRQPWLGMFPGPPSETDRWVEAGCNVSRCSSETHRSSCWS